MSGPVPNAQADTPVVDANGQRIATVTRVDEGIPYVEPADDVDPTTRAALGWLRGDPPHPLVPVHIETATETTVRLKGNL